MTARRYITLPNGRRVSLGLYVASWKELLKCDPAEKVRGFCWDAVPAGEILAAIRRGVHARINRGTMADEESPAEFALHQFHHRFTGTRIVLRQRDIDCLRLSRKLRRRIESVFFGRIHVGG